MRVHVVNVMRPVTGETGRTLDRFARFARGVEERGFAGLWVTGSFGRGRPTLDPIVLMSVIAAVTQKIEIGTCVLQAGGVGARPAWVFGMWVEPDVRRQGTARVLLRALAGWARERGADVLNLHVVATNAPAIALYERLGFHATGATEPLPHTPSVREHHMVCALEQLRSEG